MEGIGRLKRHSTAAWQFVAVLLLCHLSSCELNKPGSKMQNHKIQGIVVNSFGQPVQGAVVYIVDGPGSFPDIAAVTSEDGSFHLGGLSKGAYQLQITLSDSTFTYDCMVDDPTEIVKIAVQDP
ncbi:MAG: carboxypeptidase-like regulatory domain-containing protein [Saprospiraceae bacterium]|nr:carboxypeptidase-like regulatory domain-containing protein [Saprospiraceae bacterium]